MKHPYWLTGAAVFGMAVYLIHQLLQHPALQLQNRLAQPAANIIDTYIITPNLTSFENGLLKYTFTADQVKHFIQQEDALATNPLLQVYLPGQPHKPQWKAQSQVSRITTDAGRIKMQHEVELTHRDNKTDELSLLQTEQLTFWPKKQLAATKSAVTITTPSSLIRSVGMQANLHTQRYHFLEQVKIRIYPKG